MRTIVRLASVGAALAAFATGLASPASGTVATGQQAVRDAVKAQLVRLPGGTVDGNSVVYAKDGVKVTFVPKAAPGTQAVAYSSYCDPENLCLYADGYQTTQVLQTSSVWCPTEGDGNLYLSHYGLWGKVQSANNNTSWWARMYWEDSWGFTGAQWTLAPGYSNFAQSTAHNDFVEVCKNGQDLFRSNP